MVRRLGKQKSIVVILLKQTHLRDMDPNKKIEVHRKSTVSIYAHTHDAMTTTATVMKQNYFSPFSLHSILAYDYLAAYVANC